MEYKDRFKKGLIEMLLLKILSEHDCYGYQLTQIIKNYCQLFLKYLLTNISNLFLIKKF